MKVEHVTRWAAGSATLGAAAWAALAALAGAGRARLGVIELLFLFAPLVIVPLGLELGRVTAPVVWLLPEDVARIMQPLAAALAVSSFWFSPSRAAAMLVAPWVVVCLLVALAGLRSLFRGKNHSLPAMAANLGRIDLALAGGWLFVSRLGLRPLGFQEPIILLTAVHFHYSGFATALLAGTTVDFARRAGRDSRLLGLVVALVVLAPFALAAGFVLSPVLKLAAALILSLSVMGLAGLMLRLVRDLRSGTARGFLSVSGAGVVVGMALAGTYALGDALGKDWLLIPRMASTHGVLNALVFVLPGLLAWLVEWHTNGPISSRETEVSSRHKEAADLWPDRRKVGREV